MVDYEASPPDNPAASRSRGPHGSVSLGQSGNTRPRRSASLSDALATEDDQHLQHQSQSSNYQSNSRPTTSLGFSTADGAPTNNDGPRRVMMDERDAMSVHKKYRREADDAERRAQLQAQAHADELQHDQLQVHFQQQRQSPSPTNNPQSYTQRPRTSGATRTRCARCRTRH
ncbi:hypothetical protein B0H17DRAFT_204752 [Mycena rosella]|uniref:Uncharacterized protein n=1 Tax=Mycena rosella TaxID=1033263 RepID=A0AAD7CZR5_MYCRO|nr:hypothetical protein B0H17DRAFT_204752 [Mycena rosella]